MEEQDQTQKVIIIMTVVLHKHNQTLGQQQEEILVVAFLKNQQVHKNQLKEMMITETILRHQIIGKRKRMIGII